MFFINPIPEDKVSDDMRPIYIDIKDVFAIENVPLFFQYVANYPEYLAYIWERMKNNLQSSTFSTSVESIEKFAQKAIQEIYTPSSEITSFMNTLPQQEKEHISQTIKQLESLNTKLMLLTIGVRESIKGVAIGVGKIQESANSWSTSQDNASDKDPFYDKAHQLYTSENSLLAPLFGSNALLVTHYPRFFELIAKEMGHLVTKEAYLLTRVTLEQQSFQAISQFSFPLECSYQELMEMIGGKPHAHELVYILSVTFPSQFPHLVLTSAVMEKILSTGESNAIEKS